jgi:hypothetical protein
MLNFVQIVPIEGIHQTAQLGQIILTISPSGLFVETLSEVLKHFLVHVLLNLLGYRQREHPGRLFAVSPETADSVDVVHQLMRLNCLRLPQFQS